MKLDQVRPDHFAIKQGDDGQTSAAIRLVLPHSKLVALMKRLRSCMATASR